MTRLFLVLASCILASCSQSRLVNTERVASEGFQHWGTVKDSDVLIESGATVRVDYASQTRFFIGSGGELTGLDKGSRDVAIYQERGASVPSNSASKLTVVTNAREAWNERHTRFLPAGSDEPRSGRRSRVHVGGYYNYGYGYGHYYHSRPTSRPGSVSPSSYRKAR